MFKAHFLSLSEAVKGTTLVINQLHDYLAPNDRNTEIMPTFISYAEFACYTNAH